MDQFILHDGQFPDDIDTLFSFLNTGGKVHYHPDEWKLGQPIALHDIDRYIGKTKEGEHIRRNTVIPLLPKAGKGLYGGKMIYYNRINFATLSREEIPTSVGKQSFDKISDYFLELFGFRIHDKDIEKYRLLDASKPEVCRVLIYPKPHHLRFMLDLRSVKYNIKDWQVGDIKFSYANQDNDWIEANDNHYIETKFDPVQYPELAEMFPVCLGLSKAIPIISDKTHATYDYQPEDNHYFFMDTRTIMMHGDIWITPKFTSEVYYVSEVYFGVSPDQGESWIERKLVFKDVALLNPASGYAYEFHLSANNILLFLTEQDTNKRFLLSSNDLGLSWLIKEIPANLIQTGIHFISLKDYVLLVTWTETKNTEGVITDVTYAVYRSVDQGRTWTKVHTFTSPIDAKNQRVNLSINKDILHEGVCLIDRYSTEENTIQVSLDGINWRSITLSPFEANLFKNSDYLFSLAIYADKLLILDRYDLLLIKNDGAMKKYSSPIGHQLGQILKTSNGVSAFGRLYRQTVKIDFLSFNLSTEKFTITPCSNLLTLQYSTIQVNPVNGKFYSVWGNNFMLAFYKKKAIVASMVVEITKEHYLKLPIHDRYSYRDYFIPSIDRRPFLRRFIRAR